MGGWTVLFQSSNYQFIPLISRVFSLYCKLRTEFFSIDLWPKSEAHRPQIDGKKRGSVIYSKDRKNEAKKMFIIWLLPVWGTGNKCSVVLVKKNISKGKAAFQGKFVVIVEGFAC